jgi:hypothetical protein
MNLRLFATPHLLGKSSAGTPSFSQRYVVLQNRLAQRLVVKLATAF